MNFKSIFFVLAMAGAAVGVNAMEDEPAIPEEVAEPATIFEAAIEGNVAAVECFIARVPSLVNQSDRDGCTPLHCATKCGKEEVVRVLLAHGADINWRDTKGETPLFEAVIYNYEAIIRMFLAKDSSSIDQPNYERETPLSIAKQYDDKTTYHLLTKWPQMQRFACRARFALYMVTHPRCGANSPLQQIGLLPMQQIAKLLRPEHYEDEIARVWPNWPPTHSCLYFSNLESEASKGDVAAVERFIGYDAALVNQPGFFHGTPLYWAVGSGQEAVVYMLLAHGADINKPERSGATPLHFAAFKGNVRMVLILLDHGASVGQLDNDGRSPLCYAAQNGHGEVVRVLLKHNADVCALYDDELYIAAMKGNKAAVRLLIEHGVDVNKKSRNYNGLTPLRFAVLKGVQIDCITRTRSNKLYQQLLNF